MVQLALSSEETQLLSDVIECCIAELRGEILHTDSREFKHELKQRRQVLSSLLEKFQQFETAAAD